MRNKDLGLSEVDLRQRKSPERGSIGAQKLCTEVNLGWARWNEPGTKRTRKDGESREQNEVIRWRLHTGCEPEGAELR